MIPGMRARAKAETSADIRIPEEPFPLTKLDARIPPWPSHGLVERACPFCDDAGRPRFRRPDGLVVRLCRACSTWFVSPAPTADELTAFYRTYYARHSRHLTPYSREVLRAAPQSDFCVTEIAANLDLRGKRVLEVGCGWGERLVLFRKLGASVSGIDLNPEAVHYAQEKLGLADVRFGELQDLSSGPPFDLICMFDLIEHPLEPLDLLRRAAVMLAPGGVLAIWTPNATFAQREKEPILFRVDLEHMQYLTTSTCQRLSRIFDLPILHLETVGFPHLAGIDRLPYTGGGALKARVKGLVKRLPGFGLAQAVRNGLKARRTPERRQGNYHLFCLFEKPD